MPTPNPQYISDMAELSLLSYESNSSSSVNARWEKIGVFTPDAIVSTFSLIYDYQIIGYRSKSENLLVLAYRGTVPTSISNLIKDDAIDIAMNDLLKSIPDYLRYARIVYDQIRYQYPKLRIAHTGHSLGAATATLAAATFGEQAIVFDSPGVQNMIDNNKELQALVANQINNADIHIYLSIPNLVNKFGKHLSSAKKLYNINPYLSTGSPSKLEGVNPFHGHSIKDIAFYLKSLLDEKLHPMNNGILYNNQHQLNACFVKKEETLLSKSIHVPDSILKEKKQADANSHPSLASKEDHLSLLVKKLEPVGKKFNPLANTVIINILKTCSYFKLLDTSHIAYILATACHESALGRMMEEKTDQVDKYHWYEPVFTKNNTLAKSFSKDKAGAQSKLVDSEYNKLIGATHIFSEAIIHLKTLFKPASLTLETREKLYRNICQFSLTEFKDEKINHFLKKDNNADLQRSGLLTLIQKMLNHLFSEFNDDFLKERLQLLEGGHLINVLDSTHLLEGKTLSLIPLFQNDNKYKLFLSELRSTIQSLGKDAQATPTQEHNKSHDQKKSVPEGDKLEFFKIQVQLVMLGWLMLRIRKSYFLGNTSKGDGDNFKGRGYVQITGRTKYREFKELFVKQSSSYSSVLKKLGYNANEAPDLENRPELAADPIVSLPIMIGGMMGGRFTGKKLSAYGAANNFNFFEARRVINAPVENVTQLIEKTAKDIKEIMDSSLTK